MRKQKENSRSMPERAYSNRSSHVPWIRKEVGHKGKRKLKKVQD